MGWPSLEPFYVPQDALKHFRRCVERGEELTPIGASGSTPTARPTLSWRREFERLIAGELPEGWDREVPKFHASGSMTATRKSSETVIQWVAANVPELVGGSADLAPSTLTLHRRRRQRRHRHRTAAATSTSGSASTRWARSSTG